ncbi:cytochrome ubiquinol oxidase subunit I [Arachnia propionica]|uniref:Cytochrome ubiquinol oxidase subunit I n=1 Tax=Arachnia propionica TaxID=1750 RepID=A0A3P1T7K9_9ACTN|nr:cytochrome ubiquinol oxidase subunit I [Arachnia propionica]MDO5084398.1 cytochrome ubiquinol oxidase subunit I [Arachnia propionica]RRD05379.1 cytochrome ubiquinol oxidase subunit I [Arachnia propionica]
MDPVTIARWQFGVTTVYHFLFVPITIAMSMLVAVMQTIWVRTGQQRFLRLTKFFGKLFLINFALGVVTGIVQEFQFGMNWSEYSRFVGDIFGAPLALEALIAFFLESTFIGLWIFGWDRLPKKIHLLCIYAAAIGTVISSVFILAANSWMQNPIGAKYNEALGRAELDGVGGFVEILTNPLLWSAIPHVVTASYMVAGGLIAGIAGWHLARANGNDDVPADDVLAYRWAAKFGAWVLIVASGLTFFSGDAQAKAITIMQPYKLAAAEGAFEDTADFSLLTIPNADQTEAAVEIKAPVPGVLSFIAGVPEIKGINTIREEYRNQGFVDYHGNQTQLQQQYAEHVKAYIADLEARGKEFDPIPDVNVAYWSFRAMMALGGAGLLIGVYLLFALRGGRSPKPSKLFTTLMAAMPLMPLFAISFGWIFTEMGRQPWLVTGVMPTSAGVSPTASVGEVLFSLIVYTLLYGVLAVIEVKLFLHYTVKGLPDVTEPKVTSDPDAPMSFAY